MPLYEYYCTDCETKFEVLRPMTQADAPIQCKSCESMRTSRALSLFAAHVKGGASSSSSAALSGSAALGGGCSGTSCSSCSAGCSCGRR